MSASLFANVDSAILSYETLNAAHQIQNIDDISATSERFLVFLNLCQLSEYYCLFETLYVDYEGNASEKLPNVHDIFSHPSLGVDVFQLSHLRRIEELEVDQYEPFLDGQLGAGFTQNMINRFLESLAPPGVGQIKQIMSGIFEYDRGLAIALCAERYRDIVRYQCLTTKFSRTNCILNDKEFPLFPWVFVENQRWQDKLGHVYLPTLEEYITFFNKEDDVSASLDAGRLVRRAYGELIRHLKKITAIDDNFVASPNFLLPPITTTILSDMGAYDGFSAKNYLERLEYWRAKFETFRGLVREFDSARRGNEPRSKLVKLKSQISRSIKALTKDQDFEVNTKVDMLNTDKLAGMNLSIEDFKTGNLIKFGIDKVHRNL